MGAPPTFGVEPQRGHVAHTAPNLGAGAPVTGPLNAANLWHQLDATAAPPSAPSISSAFEMLGKPVHRPAATTVDPQETMMKALTAALSGDRKNLPSWSGDIATLRPWLRQLMLWEVDNNVPKHKWGLKLMQAFGEQSPPRRIAETIDLAILTSESGYSAILSAIMVKYGPYLEAAGPASIETFFYGTERNRNENLSTYIAAKEVALQELESHLGEKLPSRIAGRILLKHANLSDAQKEAMAVRYNALLSFGQAAAALRPLDRPDALVQKVTKTYLTAQDYGGDEDDEEEELLPADAEEPEDEEGPESDGQGNMTFLMFDPQEEYTEEEATYIWAYNSACKDVRRELQARRKGRQFFKKGNTPPVQKKGKNKGFQRRGFGKGRNSAGGAGRGRGQARGAPDELLARTKCFSCGGLGHMSRDCPHQETPQTFFAHSGSSSQSRIYAVNVKAEVQRQLDVFAGARTDDCEGVVDTAAEEAIIGSSAMSRLRAALAKFGLQPIPAEGTTATCAGIGGSATICGVFDVPVGIARTNGLLRVTEIADAGAFETPFLLPISYIELVGGVIDTGKNTFSIRGGKKTPMRRLPSGHRTISVLEFNGKWRLPEQLAKELTSSSSTNPFSLPKANSGEKLQQRPGVAVWLKRGDDLVYMGSLSSRTTLVHPHEAASSVVAASALQMVVQLWLLVQAHHNFPKAEMQTRITQWLVQADQEAPTAGRRKTSSQKLMGAWKRMTQLIMTMIFNAIKQSAMDHSLSRNKQYQVATASPTEAESKSKKTIGDGKVRRGIGRPLRRSNACKTWHCEPSKLEWAADAEINVHRSSPKSSAQSSTDRPSRVVDMLVHSDKSYPAKLPPPKYRSDLPTLVVQELTAEEMTPSSVPPDYSNQTRTPSWLASPVQETPELPVDSMAGARTSGPMKARSPSPDRRRRMTSGVRPAQHRTKSRHQETMEREHLTEQYEIHSSSSSVPSLLDDVQVVSP
ncbi:Copia protein [Durusdinium trenchii]|uniref:Copia protein n=1 Tax=Durusdinium trenchii TaxID=1381693 RepID=A0ABP0NH47_9DINO